MPTWCGAWSAWCGTALAWTNTNSPWCGTGVAWSNNNFPWCGAGPAWTNTNSPWCGTGSPWSNTNPAWCGVGSSWCGVGIPFGCNSIRTDNLSCSGSLQEFWFATGNPPIGIYIEGVLTYTVGLNEHFALPCGAEWCTAGAEVHGIDTCKIRTDLYPGRRYLPGTISCIVLPCDETLKSSTKQYTYTPCFCKDATPPVWSVSGTGASISQLGLLTTTAAACGMLTITVTQGGCLQTSQAVRVTNGGTWVYQGTTYASESYTCFGGGAVLCKDAPVLWVACPIIIGSTKIVYYVYGGATCICGYCPHPPSVCDSLFPTSVCRYYGRYETYLWSCP